jgi:hypothetical protein
MANLEDTVLSIVKDFIAKGTLFTALDVSNAVKLQLPSTSHRVTRDIVRQLYIDEMIPNGWDRAQITVTLADGSTAQAMLYHNASDYFDLDTKYNLQQRSKTTFKPLDTKQASATSVVIAQSLPNMMTVSTQVPTTITIPFPTARDQWDILFKMQPSLFPRK